MTSAQALRFTAPAAAVPAIEDIILGLGGALWQGVTAADGTVALEATLPGDLEPRAAAIAIDEAVQSFGFPAPDVVLQALPETDWVVESQKALPPQIAGCFFVHGSHVTEAPPAGLIPLLIDAAVAFGTGRHGSTQGCLLALSELAATKRQATNALDLGCGSGVLALAAAKLWHCPVLAADNDPGAVKVAAENAALNGEATLVRAVESEGYAAPALQAQAPFDLIIANILADPLIAMAGELARHLAPGGAAVLSGLLQTEADAVVAAHEAEGLQAGKAYDLGEWRTVTLFR